MVNNETAALKDFLKGLGSMEKDLTKMSAVLNAKLTDNYETILNQHTYEGEKKGKVNKKPATMSLAKDGSIKIVFDDPKEGKKLFEGFK